MLLIFAARIQSSAVNQFSFYLTALNKKQTDKGMSPAYSVHTVTVIKALPLLFDFFKKKIGSGAPFPKRFQRGGILWRRCGLVPVQRVRVVSRGPAESLHQHSHQDKTRTPGLNYPMPHFNDPILPSIFSNCPSLHKSTHLTLTSSATPQPQHTVLKYKQKLLYLTSSAEL